MSTTSRRAVDRGEHLGEDRRDLDRLAIAAPDEPGDSPVARAGDRPRAPHRSRGREAGFGGRDHAVRAARAFVGAALTRARRPSRTEGAVIAPAWVQLRIDRSSCSAVASRHDVVEVLDQDGILVGGRDGLGADRGRCFADTADVDGGGDVRVRSAPQRRSARPGRRRAPRSHRRSRSRSPSEHRGRVGRAGAPADRSLPGSAENELQRQAPPHHRPG